MGCFYKIIIPTELFKNKWLYTPMMGLYKEDIGTYYYRGNWNVLDQIHVSGGLLKDKKNGWKFWKAGIYNKPYLIREVR